MTSSGRTAAAVAVAVVVVVGALGLSAVPAAAATTISARVAKTSIGLGSSVDVTGSISDRSATRTYLQRKVPGRWVDIAAMNVRGGAFRTTIKPTGVGVYSFRVRSRAGTVVSKTFYLKVIVTLGDGSYRFAIYDDRDYSCPYGPLTGRTLTVRGSSASVKVNATLSGKVTRSGSNFSMSLDSTEPGWVANLTLNGTVKPNALLAGKLKFGGVYPSGQTGWVCDMPFEAVAGPQPGPACPASAVRRVRLPAGYSWEENTPVCSATWAGGHVRYRGDSVPTGAILKWSGSAWALYDVGCSERAEAIVYAVVFRYACWQD